MKFLGRFGRPYHLTMPIFLRVLRALSIVWAIVAVLGMGQAIAPSVEGQSMFATWAKSLGWLFFGIITAAAIAAIPLYLLTSGGQG